MKNVIHIIAKHATLSEAVKASGIDLSYNQEEAERKIRDLERGFRGNKSGEAFETTEGIFYVYHCDIKVLNQFDPFSATLTDSPFRVAVIGDHSITFSENTIPKTPQNRKRIAAMGLLVA